MSNGLGRVEKTRVTLRARCNRDNGPFGNQRAMPMIGERTTNVTVRERLNRSMSNERIWFAEISSTEYSRGMR